VQRSTTQKLKSDFATAAEDQALLDQVIDFYHETLKDSIEALSHLKQRGLRNAELIDHFKLRRQPTTLETGV